MMSVVAHRFTLGRIGIVVFVVVVVVVVTVV
jgi:hypothetical protein